MPTGPAPAGGGPSADDAWVPLVFVLIGPGGAGKGTVAERLVDGDPTLWLSRSWTTRRPRPGERPDAYHYVDTATFGARVEAGGFLEWAEFLGHWYGTPVPHPPPGYDVLLEIDLQGARQILVLAPEATVILLVPPSIEVQRQRLTARGYLPDRVEERIATGQAEVSQGRELAVAEVVNDQVDLAVAEVASILAAVRCARRGTPAGAGGHDGAAPPFRTPED